MQSLQTENNAAGERAIPESKGHRMMNEILQGNVLTQLPGKLDEFWSPSCIEKGLPMSTDQRGMLVRITVTLPKQLTN